MNEYDREEYLADMARMDQEREANRLLKVQHEAQRSEFLRTVFNLSDRVSRVVLGSTLDEDQGSITYYLKAHLDGGEIVYPESMPDAGENEDTDRILTELDALNDSSVLAAFSMAILGDDWEAYKRSEVMG